MPNQSPESSCNPNYYTRAEAALAVEGCRAWACKLAMRTYRLTGRGDLEDYTAAAVYGLWEAALRYRRDSGNLYITFATWWIRRRLHELAVNEAARGFHVRSVDRIQHVRLSFTSEISSRDDGRDYDVAERSREEAFCTDAERDRLWCEVEAVLPRQEFVVVDLIHRSRCTLREVGDALQVTRVWVNIIEHRAYQILRNRAPHLAEYLGRGGSNANREAVDAQGVRAAAGDDRETRVRRPPRCRRARA